MKKERVLNMGCMIIIVTMIGGIPAMHTQASSPKVSYLFEEIDLGAVERDPTILVVTMGESVDDMPSLSVEGNLKVHAGETIFAVFQDTYELFTDDPSQPESPELYEPFFLRGQYVRLFPEILLQEERVVLNLFDDVSVTANREQFTEEAEQYTWSGSVPDKLSFITLSHS